LVASLNAIATSSLLGTYSTCLEHLFLWNSLKGFQAITILIIDERGLATKQAIRLDRLSGL
jgi:hypothetical protein